MLQFRPLLSMKHQHRGIFHEVYSAPIAVPAVVLKVLARGTGVPQRRMTSQAVLDFLRIVPTALRATHSGIIQNLSGLLSRMNVTAHGEKSAHRGSAVPCPARLRRYGEMWFNSLVNQSQ